MIARFLDSLATLGPLPGQRVLVAVSGGADSVTLLDLLVRTRVEHRLDLVVAHVDHGISPESAAVAASVERLAQSFALRTITTRLALGSVASETTAREQRYAWLDEVRRREAAQFIVTAHHADDQVETVFLRFLHGSGPAGLAAMQSRPGGVLRPLLPFRRAEILHYARQRGLTWWEDPANHDARHLRSWLRTAVLPPIRARLPGVDESVMAVAIQAANDRAAWDQVIDLVPGLGWKVDAGGGSVAVAPLAGYDSTLGIALLRGLGRRVDCRLSREHAARALAFLRTAESGARLDLGNGWRLEIVFDRAQLLRPGTEARVQANDLQVEGEAGDGELGRWRLYWRHEQAPSVQERDGLTAWFIPQALQVRPWAAGDKVFPLGGRGHRLVVRCFQDAKVPRSLRDAWPMVTEAAGAIVWVPGICRSNRLVPPAGAEALRVDAQVV